VVVLVQVRTESEPWDSMMLFTNAMVRKGCGRPVPMPTSPPIRGGRFVRKCLRFSPQIVEPFSLSFCGTMSTCRRRQSRTGPRAAARRATIGSDFGAWETSIRSIRCHVGTVSDEKRDIRALVSRHCPGCYDATAAGIPAGSTWPRCGAYQHRMLPFGRPSQQNPSSRNDVYSPNTNSMVWLR
jgi:hypothetical protein